MDYDDRAPGPPSTDRQEEIRQQLRQLQSRNPRFRAAAARRLGDLRAEPLALLRALDDPNSFVRQAAAQSLGYAAGDLAPEAIDGLLAAIDDPNDFVCAAAIRSLGLLEAEEARNEILGFLDAHQPVIVQAAILALGRLGPPEVAAELEPFLDDDHRGIRVAAARAIGLLGYRPAGPRLLDQLRACLDRPDRDDFIAPKTYIEALARLQTPGAVPLLTEIAQHEVGLRSVAVEALIHLGATAAAPVLAQMLADPSPALRKNLLRLLLQTEYRDALPYIRPLLHDTALGARRAALTLVARWHDTESAAAVRAMCYHDPNPLARPQAVETLVALLGPDAVPDLQALAHDPNADVRRVVAETLARPEFRAAVVARRTSGGALPAPAALAPDAPALRAALERWQTALAGQPGGDVAEVQAALATLLGALRDARAE